MELWRIRFPEELLKFTHILLKFVSGKYRYAAIHNIMSGTTKCFQSPAGHFSVELVQFISKELPLHNGLLLALPILLKIYSNSLKLTQILPKFHINPFNRVRTFAYSRQKRADLGRYVFRLHNPCKIAPKNMRYSKLLKITQIYSNLLKFAHGEATGGTTHPNVAPSRTTDCTRYNLRFPTQNWDEIRKP